MAERRAVLRELGPQYRAAFQKFHDTVPIDEVEGIYGYSRAYAARRLRHGVPQAPAKRSRKATYGIETLIPLRKVWVVLGAPCGKSLLPIFRRSCRCSKASVSCSSPLMLAPSSLASRPQPSTACLLKTGTATQLKGRSHAKPGSLFKSQIAVRTRSVRNKAQTHVFAALLEIRKSLPFPLLGLDSDNGSEFINNHLSRYCQHEGLTFTRSRPYRKNDSCFVEQKNWMVVRQTVGYARYDTEEELDLLNQIYGTLRLLGNFFLPQMKSPRRQGSGLRSINAMMRPADRINVS